MTYDEYLATVDRTDRLGLRRGQHYYNVLYNLRPDLANAVCDTPADPFYDDSRIDDFLIFIQVNWDQPSSGEG